jgi:hypothetical protein
MNPDRSSLQTILDEFFERETRLTARGAERRRLAHIGQTLRECLDTDGFTIFDDCCREVFELEHQLDPTRTFLRTVGGDDLFVGLGLFLEEPWLASDLDERLLQLDTVERLIDFLARAGHVSHQEFHCHLPELNLRLATARLSLHLEEPGSANRPTRSHWEWNVHYPPVRELTDPSLTSTDDGE